MDLMTIGTFAERTRLSAKALRLYDRLGLVAPAAVDPVSGYRFYGEAQVETARLVGLLRRLGLPLPVIAGILAKPPEEAADAVGQYWAGAESAMAERRELVSYIQAKLKGAELTTYDLQTRDLPERTVLSISRHLHASETDAFFDDAFARLRASGPGLTGIEGCPFLIFYGEISEDSDGPVELCRPVTVDVTAVADGIQIRVEPAHEEVYIRLLAKEMSWSAMAPAVDALYAWSREQQREPRGPLRQVLFADQRGVTPETMVCDLSIPLK